MARNGEVTRENIMDAAQAIIMRRGFGNTSVESVIEQAGVTKGAFFHHFPTKRALGHALVERYAEAEEALFQELLDRADRLTRDPLQHILIFLGLFEEAMREDTQAVPGCLFATVSYQSPLLDPETMDIARRSFAQWREDFGGKLREVATSYPPRIEVDMDDLADMLQTVVEGALLLGRVLEEPEVVARQVAHYRSFVELVFAGDGS